MRPIADPNLGPLTSPEEREAAGLAPVPVQGQVGLDVLDFAGGRCIEELTIPAWLREADGRPSLGAMALLADSAMGWSIASRVTATLSMVTAHLRCELVRGLEVDDIALTCDARAVHVGPDVGFARAELSDRSGEPLGWASLRSAHVVPRGGERAGAPLDDTVGGVDVADVAPQSIVDALELTDESVVDGRSRVTVRRQRFHANASGGVHGGVLALMGERAINLAIDALAIDGPVRPLDLDVLYVRRLPADGGTAVATATVVNHTRRFLIVAAEVLDDSERTATLVRACYAIGG